MLFTVELPISTHGIGWFQEQLDRQHILIVLQLARHAFCTALCLTLSLTGQNVLDAVNGMAQRKGQYIQ